MINFRNRYLFAILMVMMLILSACSSKNNVVRENEPEKMNSLTSTMLGELDGVVTTDEKNKVYGIVKEYKDLKLKESLTDDEKMSLDSKIKELSAVLNEYTLKYFPDANYDKNKVIIKKGRYAYELDDNGQGASFNLVLKLVIENMNLVGIQDVSDKYKEKVNNEWDLITAVFPEDVLGTKCTMLYGFDEMPDENGVAVGAFIDVDSSTIGVNLALPSDLRVWCHEYGHMISLSEDQVVNSASAQSWNFSEDAFKEQAYLKEFYNMFWKDYADDHRADEEGALFYARHKNDFVTVYASSSCREDFAESFSIFVGGNYSKLSGRALEKMKFFEKYEKFVTERDRIQKNAISKGINLDFSDLMLSDVGEF